VLVPVHGGFGVITGRVRELLQNLPGVGREENIVAGKDAPEITFAAIRRFGAGIGGFVRRGVNNMLAIAQKIAAGSAAFAARNQVRIGAIGVHDENLIAIVWLPRGLKDEPLPVGRPVSLGVLTAGSELADVGEV